MDIFQSFTKMISDTGEAINNAASQASQTVVETAVGAGEVIGSAASQVSQTVVETAVGAGEAIGSAASEASKAVATTVTVTADAIGGAVVQVSSVLIEAAPTIAGGISGAALQTTQVAGQALAIAGKNPQLQQAIKSLNKDWLIPLLDQVDVVKAEAAVRRLQQEYPDETPAQIAHHLMLEKAVYAGGTGLVTSLAPGQAAALFVVDWMATASLSVELVYQIAAAYGLSLEDPSRKGEVLAVFGLGLGGQTAIKAGLGLLRNLPVAGAVIGASANAAMIYALGYAACRFYEVNNNPLLMAATLQDSQEESEKYLKTAIAQEVIVDQILVHIILAGNSSKTWEQILPELEILNLSPASLEAIASNIKSPFPLETLLTQVNSDFAVPLLAQCQKIAQLDGIITTEEAFVINTITNKLNLNQDGLKELSIS